MTSQLDERSAQILTSTPERTESPRRRRTWIVATAAVAGLALGAGLIVAEARTDSAGSPIGKTQPADAPGPGVNGGGLPTHLQELEKRTTASSSEGAVDRSAYAIIQNEIDKAVAEGNRVSTYRPPRRQLEHDAIDAAPAGDAAPAADEEEQQQQQRPDHQIIQNEVDAALAKRDSGSGE